MATLTTWMNNVRVGTLTRQANGAHSFRYDEEWLRSPRARPLSLSLPLQYGNITADAVYHYFDNLLPDSPQVRDRIVRRYQARSKQPFDLLAEVGRDSVGAVTLLPPGEEAHLEGLRWQPLDEAQLTALLTAYQSDIPLGMITGQDDFRISVAGAQEKTALLRMGEQWCIPHIADNKLAMNAGWDDEMLSIELSDLQGADFDLDLLGFDPAEIDQLLNGDAEAQEDEFDVDAELEKPTFSKTGDLWLLGNHRLVCGDSTKQETYDVLMDGKLANLTVTDPPYNVNNEGSAGKIKNDNMANEAF